MVTVDTFELVQTGIMILLAGALGPMFWARLNRLERRIDDLERTLRTEFRQEMAAVRQEMIMMRSDITQIALAIGVKPRLVEE